MELSHFLSLAQYEVLKSFDFSSFMQDEEQDNTSAQIQLALESVELEIPLIFDTTTKELDLVELKKENHRTKTHIDLPFNTNVSMMKLNQPLKQDAKKAKGAKDKVKGETITVEVANAKTKEDSNLDSSNIGRIKVIIKPMLK
jgi:hypothetical protein